MKKNMRRINVLAVISLAGSGYASTAASCEIDEVIKIADMTWASASTLAHIESRILEEGYGCNTQLIPGDTVPTATTMIAKGSPHIAPELWISNAEEIVGEGVKAGKLDIAGDVVKGGSIQGWWIPQYLSVKYPDLKSVHDLPRYKHLFADPSNPDKGRIYNCPPGWGCEIVINNMFQAYGLDESYVNFSPGSGAALDATIASAYKRKKPWLGYYWGPSAVLGKYEMVLLETNPYDPERDACNGKTDCASPHAGGFNNAAVHTLVTSDLKTRAPSIYGFLSKVSFESTDYNKLLAWAEDNKAEPGEVADYFFKQYPHIWKEWVTEAVAEKISQSVH